jgi:DNA-binding NarL/FixJ family response regulator
VVVEDHTILRGGRKSLLSSHPDLKVVGEAGDGLEAIRYAQNHSPDLVLMDLSMPRRGGLKVFSSFAHSIERISAS